MAWIRRLARKDGSATYWVHDKRDGKQITIAGCATMAAAKLHKEQYEMRRALDRVGYFDRIDQGAKDYFGNGS